MKRVVLGITIAVVVLALWHFFKSSQTETGNVAIIKVEGIILDPEDTLNELRDIRDNKDVKAIVLRVDSPGGSVGASQEIFESIKSLREQKKIVASFGTVAASGGYYVALPAHKIIANPGTITGSIGVKMDLVNLQELLQWARLKPETLKSGRLKDVGSSYRPMTDEEREYLTSLLHEMHAQFKAAVVEGRSLDAQKVEALADGRVFTGETAVKNGLIDGLGNLDDAIRIAGELAKIPGKPDIFYPGEKYKKFWERFVEGSIERLVAKVSNSFWVPSYVSY